MEITLQTTVNNVNLVFTDEGQGLPLVFVHGFPLSHGAWRQQVDEFNSSYRVIAPDLRGLGESETSAGASTMAQFADDLHALLKKRSTGPVVLIGHSMGGFITLAFARQFPEMLRGIVLVGTKAGNDSPAVAAGRRATAEKVKVEGVQVVIEAMAPKMLAANNHNPQMAEQVRGFMALSKPAGVIGALLGMAERQDAAALLPSITAPTLVITGADDTIIPPVESERLAQAIRGAQLKIIPNAGHLVAFEQPREFNDTMKEWLKSKILMGSTRTPAVASLSGRHGG